VVYADAGYHGIAKRPEIAGKTTEFRVAMRPGKRRALPDTPDGKLLDLVETAKAHIRAKGEHPFRVIKQLFGLQKTGQKTGLRGMVKKRGKMNMLAALTNRFLARRQLLGTGQSRKWSTRMRLFAITKKHNKDKVFDLMNKDQSLT